MAYPHHTQFVKGYLEAATSELGPLSPAFVAQALEDCARWLPPGLHPARTSDTDGRRLWHGRQCGFVGWSPDSRARYAKAFPRVALEDIHQ